MRPVLWRASVAELFIPYADPRPFQGFRNAFDVGEFGIGILANSLELGCDCLGEIRYLDVELADGNGEPYTISQAICLHEEDAGLLWKHYDGNLGTTETRRSRRLVISFILTADNYEYAIYWYFYQDGTHRVRGEADRHRADQRAAARARPAISARWSRRRRSPPHHQHFLSVRLDMAVDGLSNTVYEVDTEAVRAGSRQPAGQRVPAGQAAATPRIRGAARDRPVARPVLAGRQPGESERTRARARL